MQLKEQTALQQQQLALARADQSKERAFAALERAATRPLRVIKLNSWGLGALAITFAALKDQVAGLEKFMVPAHSSELGLFLFGLGSCLALLGVMVQMMEGQQSARATNVLTDDGIMNVLMTLRDGSGDVAQDTISLGEVASRVRDVAGIHDYAAAQSAAESILDRLSARDLISPVPERSFSPKYKLSAELIDELGEGGLGGVAAKNRA